MRSKALLFLPIGGLCGILLAVVLFALPGISREALFYDEGAYLVTAKALAAGLGYVQESLPGSPPEGKYPPLLSLSLSLFWYFFPKFPENLIYMRILMLTTGALFLAFSYGYLRKDLDLGEFEVLSIVAMVGLHPVFLQSATSLTSEIPYALLSTVGLYCYARFTSGKKVPHLALAIGFAAMAILTRTIGIALFAALVFHLLLMRRFWFSLAAAGCGGAVFIPWQWWSWATTLNYSHYPIEIATNYLGYVSYLSLTDWPAQIHRSLPLNLGMLVRSWTSFIFPWESHIIGISGVTALGVYFFGRHFWKQPRFQDLYCIFSIFIIVLWPWPVSHRFLLAISPLLISYFFVGLRLLVYKTATTRQSIEKANSGFRIAIALIVFSALGYNFNFSLRNVPERDANESAVIYTEFHRMVDWIKNNTPTDAILVADYDPVYFLFTGRKAIRLSYPDPFTIYYNEEFDREFPGAQKLLDWFRTVGACYLVEDIITGLPELHLYIRNLIEALKKVSPSAFSPAYIGEKGWFVVYKMSGCREESS